ncbi:ABC transporter ATP-binding protein [Alsobacter sp. SYSU M60028]|uniref:ABC transporter ATP-binding protein n=1 Tax=Alsobacter ponti TaxID=2962936 RepID=A0ABT1LGH9_9HYPH|nr:ABC transporter ATP-binding protein [Alsobacter ponti]MCP8940602.1 ABC transporter ATP-binding protein [Alsobacter ponti]
MAFLELSGVRKDFELVRVVRDFNLDVERGEFISFLGPSGCGKTTTLRMVAGFETPTAGEIRIAGRDVVGLKPNQRNIGMVFQSYALFPNMTVAQNVAFGLKVAGKPRAEIDARVAQMLGIIKLPQLADRYPFQLSGGQQQRVALARALAVQPQVLLLDEPLSALDAKIRVSLREEIRAIQKALGITTIYVTHDQEEALSMSDRIVVMHEGRVDQIGTPFEIYNTPATSFVASFVGTLNRIEGIIADPSAGTVRVGARDVAVASPLGARRAGEQVSLALRPEAVTLAPRPGQDVAIEARIVEVAFLGSVIRVRADIGGATITLDTFNSPASPPPRIGDAVTLHLSSSDWVVLAD